METGTFTLIRTTRARLQETAFHDGRADLKVRPDIIDVKVEDALSWLEGQQTNAEHKIIAHTSFCGSTLLARAIDVPSHVLTFREPQVLIDLANLKAANHAIYKKTDMWSGLVSFVLKQFQKSWLPSQSTVIKPSNWANTLLPDISNLNTPKVYVLISMGLGPYLIANLRGGKDRLKFSLDLLNHLLSTQKSYVSFAENIQRGAYTPLQQTLCMLALCHAIQIQTLMDLKKNTTNQCLWLTKPLLTGNPQKTILDTASHLSLSVPATELKANTAINLQYNSKMDGSAYFDRDLERNMNATLGHAYKSDIALAIDWLQTHFPQVAEHTQDINRLTDSKLG